MSMMPVRSVDNMSPIPMLPADEAAVSDSDSMSARSDKVLCRWAVLDYNNWPVGLDEVKSLTFRDSRSSEWCMVLCKDVTKALYLCFQLVSSRGDATVQAILKASVVSTRGETYEVYPSEFVCLSAPEKSMWKRLTGAFNPENGLDFSLTFLGEVRTACVKTEPYQRVPLRRTQHSVTEDLAALLESGLLSDVSLWAGGQELKAHRAVLYARSPVFAAMLRQDTQEARTGRIHVQDIEPSVLREVLRYIYTGSTPLLQKMADRLLVAADKYDLPHLKQLCEVELVKNLTVDNAADTAVIALSHPCDLLKRSVISFVKRHLEPVMGSGGWATAVTNHSEIVVKLSHLIANTNND